MSTTEVPISHAEAARRVIDNLQTLQSSIEGFAIPPKPLDTQSRPRGHRHLPDPFFIGLAVALETSPQLAAVLQAMTIALTPADIRDMLRHGEAYLPLAEALERFARGIRYMVGSKRAKIGRLAVSAYRAAQGMNLHMDVSLPVPEAESMKRAFGTRRRKVATVPEPAPATTKASSA